MAIRTFCYYAALGMFFDLFNQITLFIASVAFDLRRSDNTKGDCCGLVFCSPNSKMCCKGKFVYNKDGTMKQKFSNFVCGNVYSKMLMKAPVRCFIIIGFLGLSAYNIYELTQFRFEFSYEWFVQDDFYVKNAMTIRDDYFENIGRTLKVVSHDTQFSSEEAQNALLDLENKLNACDSCDDMWIIDGSTDSWYCLLYTSDAADE